MKRLIALVAALGLLVLAAPAGAQDEARIHLLHGIPGVDVDVEAGGEVVFENYSFGEMQDLSALAGETLTGVAVKITGTDDVVIDAGDLTLPSSGNYTIIPHLDEQGTPIITVYENDTAALAAGQGRLVVRHTAAAPAVDVRAGGEVVFPNLANAGEASADLPAGSVSADVVPAGADEPVVIGPADLPVSEGSALIVYAVGSLDEDSLTVLTESISGLGSSPTAVSTGNSPIDDDRAVSLGVSLLVAAAGVLALGALGLGLRKARR